jgi:predicted nucleic acid-binding protein
MDAVLLDTDVFSYLLKRDDSRADAYRRHVANKTIAISFVTVGELYGWSEKRRWSGKRREDLETRLRSVLVVPFDLDLCRAYGRLVLLKTADGTDRSMAANDRWIAACAIRHGLTLISNNRRHFEGIPDLTLISEAPAPKQLHAPRLPIPEEPE